MKITHAILLTIFFLGSSFQKGNCQSSEIEIPFGLEREISFKDSYFPYSQMKRPKIVLALSGGGARSSLWRDIIANVFELPLYRPSHLETTAAGTAFLCAAGIKMYSDVPAAGRAADLELVDRIEPATDKATEYERVYQRYLRLEEALAPLYAVEDEE